MLLGHTWLYEWEEVVHNNLTTTLFIAKVHLLYMYNVRVELEEIEAYLPILEHAALWQTMARVYFGLKSILT